jgi:hypothetical protein
MMAACGDGKMTDTSKLTAEARRALAEAEQRHRNATAGKLPKEINGRLGPEPTRFGDWETKGIASDF